MPRSPGSSGCPAAAPASRRPPPRSPPRPARDGIKSGPGLDSAVRRWSVSEWQPPHSHASLLKAE
eukprot:15438159-Alexandrium_andersonii.AAC.1